MCDAIAIIISVISPVHTQESLPVLRPLTILPSPLVCVRGAEFSLKFPQEVRQFRARTDALDQRSVLSIDGIPIDTCHIFGPELLPLQTPGLCKHLPPLCRRLHRDFDTSQIEPTIFSAGI